MAAKLTEIVLGCVSQLFARSRPTHSPLKVSICHLDVAETEKRHACVFFAPPQ